jgi:hypothetical protein
MSSSRWSRKIWPLAVFFRLLAGCTTLDGPAVDALNLDQDVLLYGRWAVGCDNMPVCTAIAPLNVQDGKYEPPFVRMTWAGTAADNYSFSILRAGEQLATLSPKASELLLQDLRNSEGSEYVHVADQAQHFDIPRSGFAQLIATLGEWQKRKPSAANRREVVTPLPALRLENPIPPLKILGAAKRCPKGHMGQSLQAWRGLGGQTLWRAGCGDEGLNSTSFWYVAGPQGDPATEVVFADRDGQPVTLYNSWFDEKSGYLRSAHYFGHWESYTEDCGIYRSYSWGVEGMKLVEQRLMPQCGTGIGPDGWIVTYRATVLNGPDSGP